MQEFFLKKILILILPIFIIITYVPSTFASPKDELRKAEQKVTSLENSKTEKKARSSWLRCASEFKKIVRKYPKSSYAARALLDMGNLYTEIYDIFKNKDDIEDALKSYSTLIENYPKSSYTPEAHYRKGAIYLTDLKDQAKASLEFENITTRYPRTEFSRKAADRLSEIEAENKRVKVVTVKDLEHHSTKNYTRIVVELDGPVKYEHHRIKDPDRLYFDFKNSRIGEELQRKTIPINDGILRAVRISQNSSDVVRVVLDLDSIESFKAFQMENPERLVIDISGISKQKPLVSKETSSYAIRRIVIDPGHGGHDPGAIGKNGLEEKDVVLDISRRLRDLIKKELDIEVILTRDSDIFIPLPKRTAIANMKEADLFLSIHANASPNRNARGIETYFLNYTNDEESNRVAARENDISLKRQKELQRKFQTDLEKTFGDLERDNKRDESLRLAHMVQNSIVDKLKTTYNVSNLGVKWNIFYVLMGAKMPSILAEVSFISNREEEKRLRDEEYRQKIAQALLVGVKNYISSRTVALMKRESPNIYKEKKSAGILNEDNLH